MTLNLADPRLWAIALGVWFCYLAWWRRKQTLFELLSIAVVAGGCAAILGFKMTALYLAIGVWSLVRK